MKTRAALLMLAAMLTAGPAYANEIICFVETVQCRYVTYEHAFNLDAEEFNPSGSHDPLPTPYDLWAIPPFDSSLGIPEVLLIDIEGAVTINGRIDDLAGAREVSVFAIATILGLRDRASNVILDGYKVCTAAPCEFSFGPSSFGDFTYVLPTPYGWESPWWDADPGLAVTLPIPYWSFGDTYFALEGEVGHAAAPITLRTGLSGVARATYIYEVTELPEPSTLLLLGGGLLGAAWTRRRRRN